ncbi:MAG TPA: hypothetical protein VFJ97_01570 [Dermatophilaceae bacterium]|nr:hypothetical protein [Dermatophilaceae bacterium]
MTAPAVAAAVARIATVLPGAETLVKVGVEAAGHYHRPMLSVPTPAFTNATPAGRQGNRRVVVTVHQ